MKLILTLILLLPISQAFARGTEGGGGGIVFVCRSQTSEFNRYAYLADTYETMKLKDQAYFETSRRISVDRAVEAITKAIQETDPTLASQITENLAELKFDFSTSELPLLGDDDITAIPEFCEKKQMAIQDLATGVVRTNSTLFWQLSPIERALFKLHEAYVRIYRSNSSTVRTSVDHLAWSEVFTKALDRLSSNHEQGYCDSPVLAFLWPLAIPCMVSGSVRDTFESRGEQAAAYICETGNLNGDKMTRLCSATVQYLVRGRRIDYKRVFEKNLNAYNIRFNNAIMTFNNSVIWPNVLRIMKSHGYRYVQDREVCYYTDAVNPDAFKNEFTLIQFLRKVDHCFQK